MDDTCPICFIHINNSIKLTLCNHTFCVECIKKWIDTPNYTCPCCRSKISSKDFITLDIEYIACEKNREVMYNKNEIDMREYEKKRYDLIDKMKYRKFIHGHTLEFYDMEMNDLRRGTSRGTSCPPQPPPAHHTGRVDIPFPHHPPPAGDIPFPPHPPASNM